MTELCIVTPQEANDAIEFDCSSWPDALDLLLTVATEPERIAAAERAAVVKALEAEAQQFENGHVLDSLWGQRAANALWLRASQVASGVDW